MSSHFKMTRPTFASGAARTLLLTGAASLGALALGTLTLGTLALGTASAQTAAPAPVKTAPAKPAPAKPATTSAATTQAASAIAIEISAAVKGQIVGCPAALKLSPRAVCLYVPSGAASLRPLIAGKLSGRTVAGWKTTGKASTLLVSARAGGPLGAFVLLSALNDKESLVAVDAAQVRPATPAGVVKGQPYVLGRDLAGVVNVVSQGAGVFRLSTEGGEALTVTVGRVNAQASGGTVVLPLAPATDGKNLIFPLAGLRSLGCTTTPAGTNLTVTCGADSIGLKPIVF